jgi:hypothetical protein
VKQTNSEGFGVLLELKKIKEKKNAILNDELFQIIIEAYPEQLAVYSDKKEKNIYGLELSDKEIIVSTLISKLRRERVDEAFKELYRKKKVVHERIDFKKLAEEFNLAVTDSSGNYFWKIPDAIEFYTTIRKIIQTHPTERNLDDVIGMAILRKYPIENVKEYYSSRSKLTI